jgi:hypothetical protein
MASALQQRRAFVAQRIAAVILPRFPNPQQAAERWVLRMSASGERWHSIREIDRKVYHDDPTCPDGAGVEPTHRREGTAGRKKCEQCSQESGLA